MMPSDRGTGAGRPDVLIESWLPFETVGAESQRDASAAQKTPLNRLHVWWARRPLTVSRAAIVASVLPPWSAEWPARLQAQFPTREAYRAWFVRFLGILGDPVQGRKLIQWAKERGIKLKEHPYGGAPRAFTVSPSEEDLETMRDLLELTWGTRDITVMDPMAGGGSIPFEALRYGFTTYANELNPVASVILKATLDYPARFGPSLAEDVRKWGKVWAERARERLAEFFPRQPGESIQAYLWARTVACPSTGKPVPLSPNWWLSRGSNPVAVRVLADPSWDTPRFDIVRGRMRGYDPSEGTIRRGVGRSPWTGEAIDGDYIKREAQAGRMGHMLYAVAAKRRGRMDFRVPSEADLEAVSRAEEAADAYAPRWQAEGLVPSEEIPEGVKTGEPHRYGMYRWMDLFSPRQLLSQVAITETLSDTVREMADQLPGARVAAVSTLLAFAVDKCADRNAVMTRWIPQRHVIANTFDRHDFAMKWSYAEFDAAANILPWALSQVEDAYKGLADLINSTACTFWGQPADAVDAGTSPGGSRVAVEGPHVTCGSASSLGGVADASVQSICVDPPYYDNVMYAELSDFFYVWLKRAVGDLYPELFRDRLVGKDDEAVANVARFDAMGGRKPDLARKDYERKMAASLREMHRVLRDDGVLTLMFTHKQVEAWDTLASALIGAGFTIEASWPVHTEFEHSLHQAKKNAAASTILLVCRKRAEGGAEPVWWDDIQGRVRQTARERAQAFADQGVQGVDLYISTFGPVLSVISEQWPVLTSQVDPKTGKPLPLRPETALDLAREEVVALRKRGLLLGRDIQFDAVTDWYLMAWDAFKAQEFPADEARKLALALGLDVEEDLVRRERVISKKGSRVVLQEPRLRRRKGLADPDALTFNTVLDAVHAAMVVCEADGTAACEAFLKRTGLRNDGTFRACVQAMLNAIPRTQGKKGFVRPEAAVLERMRLALFEDLEAPAEEEPKPVQAQLGLWSGEEETEDDEEEVEDGDEA